MDFRISDTFTDSLAKLIGNEQKAVKTTAFDLQLNPARPGPQFHKLDKARDPNFWSVRVSRDARMIVHRTQSSLLLCYVDHHDNAYQWAERRKLETHPKTGAAQVVEVRETVQEITVPTYVPTEQDAPPKPALFTDITETDLLGYGVPAEWLKDVRSANEEALLELAVGGVPQLVQSAAEAADPFEHPDAQRHFRVMHHIAELVHGLDHPWEKWTVFLHPAQRQIVEKGYSGPSRLSGAAGTGKTIVAIHRAVFLARANSDARVLLTTFSDTLGGVLQCRLTTFSWGIGRPKRIPRGRGRSGRVDVVLGCGIAQARCASMASASFRASGCLRPTRTREHMRTSWVFRESGRTASMSKVRPSNSRR